MSYKFLRNEITVEFFFILSLNFQSAQNSREQNRKKSQIQSIFFVQLKGKKCFVSFSANQLAIKFRFGSMHFPSTHALLSAVSSFHKTLMRNDVQSSTTTSLKIQSILIWLFPVVRTTSTTNDDGHNIYTTIKKNENEL